MPENQWTPTLPVITPQEADDTLWYDGHTTAHERLCDIAIKYDPLLAEELERRLEESCGPGGDS